MGKSSAPTEHKEQERPTQRRWVYIGTIVILVLVIVTFIGGPALSGFVGSGKVTFGRYGRTEITYVSGNYFQRTFQNIASQVQESGQEVTDAVYRQIWRNAYDATVLHLALLETAEEAQMGVSDEAVDEAVARWPALQENGRFSPDRYYGLTGQQRSSLRQYLEQSLVAGQVRQDIYSTTVASEAEVAFVKGMASPERQFRFVAFPFSDFPDDRVSAYVRENASRFRRANLSRITITSSKQEAEQIRDQAIERQATFEDLARAHSTDMYADDGGDMDWVYYHELEPDFENVETIDQIFSLPVAELSPVVQTTYGWAIYRVDGSPIDPDMDSEQLIIDARSYLTAFEPGLLQDYSRGQAEAFRETALESDFDAAATAIDQSPLLTAYFPVNYGNFPYFSTVRAPSAESFANAAYDEQFFIDAFALGEGDVSEPVALRDRFLVLQLADERSAPEESMSLFDVYLPYIYQEIAAGDIQRVVIDTELLEDNFDRAYNTYVRGN